MKPPRQVNGHCCCNCHSDYEGVGWVDVCYWCSNGHAMLEKENK